MLHGLPVDGVVDVAVQVNIGRAKRPPRRTPVRRRIGKLELRRRSPAAGHLGVDTEALDPGRSLFRVEVDPDAVHLSAAVAVAPERPPPTGRDRGEAAAPGDEFDLAVAKERLDHVDPDPPQEPQVLRHPPARLFGVLDRDVLEEARDGVEPDSPLWIDVCEPDPASCGERPPAGRPRYPGIEHRPSLPGQPRAASPSRRRRPVVEVRMRGLEPPRPEGHTDLNRARLPIPPHPRGASV